MQDKNISKVAGGEARAKALSPEKRKEIALRAASARWGEGAFRATHVGEINLAGVAIPCAVLEDGRRLLSLSGLTKAFGSKPGGREYREHREGDGKLPVFLGSNSTKRSISQELASAVAKPISFRYPNGLAEGKCESRAAGGNRFTILRDCPAPKKPHAASRKSYAEGD